MASSIKPFNSVGGYSTGPNLTPFLDANNNANVANLTVEGSITGNSASLTLTGDLTVEGISNLDTLNVANAAVFDSTVDVTGVLTVTGNVDADDNLNVTNNAIIGGFANVTGILTVTANIDGDADFNLAGNADITGTLAAGETTITGNLIISNAVGTNGILTDNLYYSNGSPWDLQAPAGSNTQIQINTDGDFGASANFTFNTDTSAFTVNGTSNVTGIATFGANIDGGANLNLTGSADITGQLIVDGAATLNGATEIANTLLVTDAANIDSTLRVGGNLTANANVEIAGALDVNGDVTLDGAETTVTGNLTVQGLTTNFTSDVLFTGGGLSHSVTFDETDLTSNGSVTLSGPSVDLGDVANLHIGGGSNAQYLSTDGTGNLTWTSLDTDTLANGTSNVSIDVADGPITMGVNGTANIAVFGETYANFIGDLNVADTVTADTLYANTLANVYALTVRYGANVQGELQVMGAANIANTLTVTSTLTAQGALELSLNANIGGALQVAGAANVDNTLVVSSTITGLADLDIADDAVIGGNANVTGNINGGTNLNLTGSANIVTDLLVGGNANVTGTANIGGAVELGSTLDVTGVATFASDANVQGDFYFVDANGTTLDLTSGLTTGTITANGNVTLGDVANVHIAGGTDGQVLKTDGNGVLTWSSNVVVNAIQNGTSNVAIASADGNVVFGVNGQANVIVVSSDGTTATTSISDDVLITGNLTVQGNVTNIDTTTLNVEDPVITEGRGPNNAALTVNDGMDRGLFSWYFDGSEKAGFVGLKNPGVAGDFAGKYVIADQATIANNTVTVSSYADVVVSSIVAGADTSGGTAIDLNAGNVVINVDGTNGVLTVADTQVTANANVVVTNGAVNVVGGSAGTAYGSEVTLATGLLAGGTTVTTLGSGSVATSSSTPTPIVTIPDAAGRTAEFFISARQAGGPGLNYEGAKYLMVSDGDGNVDWTSYGQVRMGNAAQQISVTFGVTIGGDIEARVAVLDNTTLTLFSTQYQIVG